MTIIELMKQCGYTPENGMCYGLACMATLSVIRHNGKAYFDRIQRITDENFSTKENQPYSDIFYFFDGVSMYQNMSLPDGFTISPNQCIEFTSKLFEVNQRNIKEDYIPHVCQKFLWRVFKLPFLKFLEKLQTLNQEAPFSLLINYLTHSVQIGFDGNQWLSVNHDKTVYTQNIVEAIDIVLDNNYTVDDQWPAFISVLSSKGNIILPKAERLTILPDISCCTYKQLVTLFKLMLSNGHSEAVANFSEAVFKSKLSYKEKFELLAAKAGGAPGFCLALEYGHSEVVANFAEVVLQSEFSDNEKFELLAAKAGGTPGLYFALAYGHSDAVANFVGAVLNSDLDKAVKIELLAARSSSGTPGLYLALAGGHSEAVANFVGAVLNSDLDPIDNYELLAANTAGGTPGLYSALSLGYSEAVVNFVGAVLKSKLSHNVMFELLAAKTAAGSPGFCVALSSGHSETVAKFAEVVLKSNIDTVDKLELLAATDKSGTPGFNFALSNGHIEAVAKFAKVVLKSGLNKINKFELLAPRGQSGVPGPYLGIALLTFFFIVLLDNHVNTFKVEPTNLMHGFNQYQLYKENDNLIKNKKK